MLLIPNSDLIDLFNSFWTVHPLDTVIPLFEDGEAIDITNYISQFCEYADGDESILFEHSLYGFFYRINAVYHTRVSGIDSLVNNLVQIGIDDKDCLINYVNNNMLTFNEFLHICRNSTGKYTYSFASKVFSFIDQERFPIIDRFVVTVLDQYEYDNKVPRTEWGNYYRFIDNYEAFRNAYNLFDKSYKEIDKFLWTYGKILSAYWSDLGILTFNSVQFDPNS